MLSRAASWVLSRRVGKTPIFNWPSSLLRLRIYTFSRAHPGGSIRTQLPKLQNRSNFTLITPPAVRPTPNQPSQSTATLPHYLMPNKLKNTYQPSQSTAKLSHYFNVRQLISHSLISIAILAIYSRQCVTEIWKCDLCRATPCISSSKLVPMYI